MDVLDTSIANMALPHIAGSFGASTNKSTWVLTSYLVSNAMHASFGFRLVGTVPGALYVDGKYCDEEMMALDLRK